MFYQLIFISKPNYETILVGISGKASIVNNSIVIIDGVYGEAGTQTINSIKVLLPDVNPMLNITNVYLNGIEKSFQQVQQMEQLEYVYIFNNFYFLDFVFLFSICGRK